MNKKVKKISTLAVMLLMIGSCAIMTACNKDETLSKEKTIIESKGVPVGTAIRLAKYLGINPEAIVDVEYKSGQYHSRDETRPDGTKIHEWWCEDKKAACATVVHVKVGVKSTPEDYNGLIAVRSDKSGIPLSVVLMFENNNIDLSGWIHGNNLVLDENLPFINLNLMEGFGDGTTAFVEKGVYCLESFENLLYTEIPVDNMVFEDGIFVEI